MLKKYLLLFLFVNAAHAQNKVDSLVTAIRNKPVVEQINLLNDLCWNLRDSEPALAIHAAEISLTLSQSIDDKQLHAKALNYLSVIYRDQGAYEKSLGFSTYALQLAQSVNNKVQIAYSYNNISTIYRLMGNYPAALEKLYKALEIFESINDKVGIGYCYYNLGFVYLKQKNYSKALQNFEATVRIREELRDEEGKTKALGRIAEIYLHQGEYEKANTIFNNIKKAFANLKDQRGLISIGMGLAELYTRKNQLVKAIEERQLALTLSEKFNDVIGIVNNASELGVLYAMIGKFTEGKKYLERAREIARKYDSSELKLTNYKNYAEFFEIQKDFTNAYKFAKLHKQYQDSVSEKEKNTAISEVELAYRINKKEKEKDLIQKDLEKQQERIRYGILITVLFIGLAVVATVLYFFKRRTTQKLTELNATKDKFFSIIAHDLKNPITTQFSLTSLLIESYDEMKDEERLELIKAADNAGKQTYKLLENLLYWSRSQTGRLEYNPKEIKLYELVQESFNLLRENAKTKNVALISPEDQQFTAFCDEDMIKTVLRNLISNAIKFSDKDGVVKIKFEEKGDRKVISVVDNGVGISDTQLRRIFKIDSVSSTPGTSGERGTGLGLVLCKEFVEKNGGKIWVESEVGKGSTFSFSLLASAKL